MPAEGDIRTQVARESERRSRLAVPALAGGVLYMLGTIVLLTSSNGAPRVGLLQGLAPALSGVADPAVSPRAQYVKYISQHAFGAVAGSVVTALSLLALTLILLVLFDATRFRRPQTWSAARPLLMIGGPVLAFVTVGHEVVIALQAHSFAVGHDLSNRAVDHATTKAAAIVATASLGFVAWVALTAGMVATMINAQRVGLLPRWVSFLGMFAALLIFFGGGQLAVIPAFWMVMIGILFAGRWPNGLPAAWDAGEARPWPTAAERRAEREGGAPTAGKRERGRQASVPASAPPTPAPAAKGAQGKRRRKRGARR